MYTNVVKSTIRTPCYCSFITFYYIIIIMLLMCVNNTISSKEIKIHKGPTPIERLKIELYIYALFLLFYFSFKYYIVSTNFDVMQLSSFLKFNHFLLKWIIYIVYNIINISFYHFSLWLFMITKQYDERNYYNSVKQPCTQLQAL